jgi:hypothetical protein
MSDGVQCPTEPDSESDTDSTQASESSHVSNTVTRNLVKFKLVTVLGSVALLARGRNLPTEPRSLGPGGPVAAVGIGGHRRSRFNLNQRDSRLFKLVLRFNCRAGPPGRRSQVRRETAGVTV